MSTKPDVKDSVLLHSPDSSIGPYSYDEFIEVARRFHGSPAPGLILGGYMVEEAKRHLPEGTIFDAISETSWCLPDAVQLLTLCSTGNGWLRVKNLGVYALSLFDKYTGHGVRIRVDPKKIEQWSEIYSWFLKLKPKKEQDSVLLHAQIRQAGPTICSIEQITVKPTVLRHRSKGGITICPLCGDAYPGAFGCICRSCQGEGPYSTRDGQGAQIAQPSPLPPSLQALNVNEAVGRTALHDMTKIDAHASKGAEFHKGHNFSAGDICRLQLMGKNHVYVQEGDLPTDEWIHENEVADSFARIMCGEGTIPAGAPREGKVTIQAERDGLFVSDVARLTRFNLVPNVMVAARKNCSLVKAGTKLAGTRAVPLYLERTLFSQAVSSLEGEPLFQVVPLPQLRVGLLITGNEVFNGLIEDKFEPVITAKIKALGSTVEHTTICPDDREMIRNATLDLMERGCQLIITTAGLSVDPDDVTRHALVDAGASDLLYGAPILPGAMLLLARSGDVRIIGVPACALFYKTTSLDLILPRVLAGLEITRKDLAEFADGGFCMECKTCTFPKCPMGK
ncbi:MAG: FmdE family protein [Desulfovibrio sp.]|uniref:FmdE family protein n=1 Tax=Desulfovibrio sp. 7SRBS1 TaxID=3378064 RepID=UPI003B3FB690